MSTNSTKTIKRYVYHAPVPYVVLFYGSLAVWTIICVTVIGSGLATWKSTNAFQLFMIAFILFYTWYFSIAISYKVEVGDDGSVQLTSFRRILVTNAAEIPFVEGPHLPIGFVKFRLEREKAYLFCLVNNASLKQILSVMRTANPNMKFKRL